MNRRELFVREYLLDLNATAAAERAGYSPKSSHAQGCRLLRNAETKSQIDAALARRGRKLDIRAADVLQELARLAFYDVRDIFNADGSMKELCELDGVTAAAISGFEVAPAKGGAHTRPVLRKIRLADKAAALERLGRHLGIFEGTPDAPNDRLQELIDAMNAGPVAPGTTVESHLTTEPRKGKHERVNYQSEETGTAGGQC